ncbi:MAG: PHP domain-containing protein [Parcubacteria group bacterium]|nr:PHP domain-containing protein [Parcubacteria group bacterium]
MFFKKFIISALSLINIFLIFGCAGNLEAIKKDLENFSIRNRSLYPIKLNDYKGVIHVHTSISHDSEGKIDEIIAAAHQNNLDFVILNDHNDQKIFRDQPQGLIDGILFIRGTEIIKDKTDILAIAPKKFIDKSKLTWEEITEELRGQNSLIAIAHPDYLYKNFEIADYDAIEIYDIFDDALTEPFWKWPGHIFRILCCWKNYQKEIFLQILDRPDNALKKWDENLKNRHVTAIAGNDTHQNVKIWGKQLDPYWLSFNMVSVHVQAPELREAAVLEALKNGRTYISFDIVNGGNFNELNFYAEFLSKKGEDKIFMMGGTANLEDTAFMIRFETRLTQKGKIRFFRNGQVIDENITASLTTHIGMPGVYRVEVERQIAGSWYPWIISNPIYVK